MKHLALVVALLALAAPAYAQESASFGDLGYGGTGCPDGTATSAASGSSLSVDLDAYAVGDNGRSLDRKTCGLAIPVTVPDGVQVAIRGIALRGAANLPDGQEGTLSVEAFTAGDSGEIIEFGFTGPTAVNFFRFVTVPNDKLVWSGCGEDTNLRLNTSLRAKGNADSRLAVTGLSVLSVATRAC